MKRTIGIVLTGCLVAAGCATRTQTGAAVGTGVGAAAGAALGQAIGKDTESTLIGAAAGALAGGLAGGAIGRYMDNQEAELEQALANAEAASVRREANVLAVTFKSDVAFDVGSAQLHPGAMQELGRVAEVLGRYPQTRITVNGHTDATGGEAMNQEKLSQRRAESVKNALLSRGVDASRVVTVGHGESQPIATNDTAEGRQLNRRVEILIIPNQA